MLEVVDLHKNLDPVAYRRVFPNLQEKLRTLQYAVHEAEIPMVIAIEGWDASGRGEMIKQLSEVLDPRLFRAFPGTPPTPLELRHHFLWRYQIDLPNDGEMTVFDHSWYGRVLVERVDKLVSKKEWQLAYEQINEFERWLADDKQIVLKFWLHISKKQQRKRFKKFKADPNLAWKISKEYRRHHRQYDKWVVAVEEMLAKTDSPHAPWVIVEAYDQRWARVRVFETLIQRMEEALARRAKTPTEVYRTTAAREALATERERKQRADTVLARQHARQAGLPLEEEAAGKGEKTGKAGKAAARTERKAKPKPAAKAKKLARKPAAKARKTPPRPPTPPAAHEKSTPEKPAAATTAAD